MQGEDRDVNVGRSHSSVTLLRFHLPRAGRYALDWCLASVSFPPDDRDHRGPVSWLKSVQQHRSVLFGSSPGVFVATKFLPWGVFDEDSIAMH